MRLRDNIKSHINRQFYEFKKNRKMNPASLKNRIRMLELGFIQLTEFENREAKDFLKNFGVKSITTQR